MKAILFLHIAGGSLAVLAGYAALFAPKGGWLHRKSGVVFVYAMIAMGAGAMIVGLDRGKSTWLGGPFVFYLVVTSLLTIRRTVTPSRTRDMALMGLGIAMCIASIAGGIPGIMAPPGTRTDDGLPVIFPAVMSFVNAFVMLLCVTGDFRMLRSGPRTGPSRLRRHLWRMCYAMFTATGSFFLGQADVIPKPLRIQPLLFVLAFLPLLLMPYYLWRPRKHSKKLGTPLPVARSPQYGIKREPLEAVK